MLHHQDFEAAPYSLGPKRFVKPFIGKTVAVSKISFIANAPAGAGPKVILERMLAAPRIIAFPYP
jgi:hypothetical protein